MALCLRIGTAGMWRRDDRWVVTDVSTYHSSFIFLRLNSPRRLHLDCLFLKMEVLWLSKRLAQVTQKHDSTSWQVSVILPQCELHKLLIIAMWRAIVAAQLPVPLSVQMSAHKCLCLEGSCQTACEGNLSFVRRMCQHCSVICLFVLSLKTASAGDLYV